MENSSQFRLQKTLLVSIEQVIDVINSNNNINTHNISLKDNFKPLIEASNHAQDLEYENQELRDRVEQLEQELKNESNHTKEILPKYRESLEKLKANSKLMRDKIQELKFQKDKDQQTIQLLEKQNQQLQAKNQELLNQNNAIDQNYDNEIGYKENQIQDLINLNKEKKYQIDQLQRKLQEMQENQNQNYGNECEQQLQELIEINELKNQQIQQQNEKIEILQQKIQNNNNNNHQYQYQQQQFNEETGYKSPQFSQNQQNYKFNQGEEGRRLNFQNNNNNNNNNQYNNEIYQDNDQELSEVDIFNNFSEQKLENLIKSYSKDKQNLDIQNGSSYKNTGKKMKQSKSKNKKQKSERQSEKLKKFQKINDISSYIDDKSIVSGYTTRTSGKKIRNDIIGLDNEIDALKECLQIELNEIQKQEYTSSQISE